MQEKDLKISYKILHFYPDLRGEFTLLLAKIVHFFPVKVEKILRNLKVFFLRSKIVLRNLKVFFLHRKGKTHLNSVCFILRRETEKSSPREWRKKCLIFDQKRGFSGIKRKNRVRTSGGKSV